MKAVKLPVISHTQVSRRYWHIVLDASRLDTPVSPGQFFHIRCGVTYYPFLRRPISVYRINPEERTLEFLYLVKGLGTQRLTELAPGDEVDVFGPLGRGFTLQSDCRTILLLARGVGIATLAALAQEAATRNIRCVAILSARSRDDLLAAESLAALGAEVYKVTDEEGTSSVEQVRTLLERLLREKGVDAAYVCGSKRLSLLLQEIAKAKRLPAEIALEEHMGCAMGVCFACVCDLQEEDGIKTVRVCREGPVFPLEKVVIR